MTIGIVGCGNLGFSLLNGIRSKNEKIKIIASKRSIKEFEKLNIPNTKFTSSNSELIVESEIVIIALKPYNVPAFLEEHKNLFDPKRHSIISVSSGMTIDEMTIAIGKEMDIFRAMPNTASAVNESVTAIAIKNDSLNRTSQIQQIFNTLGLTIIIDEKLIEAATIVGACGIAYVLRFMRAMIQGGIEVGFDAETATKIVSQTVKGAAHLIITNGTHPEAEIDRVTTPKGCTIVGLNEMEHSGFSSALIKGIVASYEKIEKK